MKAFKILVAALLSTIIVALIGDDMLDDDIDINDIRIFISLMWIVIWTTTLFALNKKL